MVPLGKSTFLPPPNTDFKSRRKWEEVSSHTDVSALCVGMAAGPGSPHSRAAAAGTVPTAR